MTETDRTALAAAFMAATVVAGLSLSLVPHLELVTLTVFAAGILLGSGRGALVGAVGMPLYVFANSAVRGFPPSPLPVLLAQSLGMAAPGFLGGIWRRFWIGAGIPRRSALLLLPVLGAGLAALYQALLNFSFVMIMSETQEPRTALFVSGMAFGILDMVWNGVMFGLAGPTVAYALRRVARRRGWWGATAFGVVLATGLGTGPGPAGAQVPAPRDTVYGAPDSPADSTQADAPPGGGAGRPSGPAAPGLRPRTPSPSPLWQPFPHARASVLGLSGISATGLVDAATTSWVAPPMVPVALDRWAMGWGRTRYSYDGLPFRGAVYGYDEPPDVPGAWRGGWLQKWGVAGTSIRIPAPRTPEGAPLSQISLTTGALGRRSGEFTLFRNLGSVDLGLDFMDREAQGRLGIDEVQRIRHDRLWLHLGAVGGSRPAWTLDLSAANETRDLGTSDSYPGAAAMDRDVRRVQASLEGPFLGGETRLAGQWRRQTLQTEQVVDSFGEVVFDGFTLQADWAAAVIPGLDLSARFERDRRRGILEESRSFLGVHGLGNWSGHLGPVALGADGKLGHQEPYGFTWEGSAMAEVGKEVWKGRVAWSHEEDLPPMVIGLDRPSPEAGMELFLDVYETAVAPESRSVLRLEGNYAGDILAVTLGGWAGWQRNYYPDNNPVWVRGSLYEPVPRPADANIHGGFAEARLTLIRGFFAQGQARFHDRPKTDVPYLSNWSVKGSLHWRRRWFRGSILLDASIGGTMIGPRRNPDGEEYLSGGIGFVELLGRVDNGVVTLTFENLIDNYLESDLRRDDLVTPIPIAGRTITVGLTMYLTN